MDDPPELMGGDHKTVAVALPPVVVTFNGALGVVAGVTCVVAAGPAPTAFLAVTDNVYETPLVSPVK